jgi:hypothetical protein
VKGRKKTQSKKLHSKVCRQIFALRITKNQRTSILENHRGLLPPQITSSSLTSKEKRKSVVKGNKIEQKKRKKKLTC